MPVDPASLKILQYPDPLLRRKAAPVTEFNDELRRVADRMIDLMREAEGIGLAAPQVGLSWRLFVVDIPPGEDRSASDTPATATAGPVVYVNPTLAAPHGAAEAAEEGCLSLPDIRGDVLRPPVVTITAQDLSGRTFTQAGAGLLARCWQHEHDHLEGVLIIDRMSQIDRLRNRSAIRQFERQAGIR